MQDCDLSPSLSVDLEAGTDADANNPGGSFRKQESFKSQGSRRSLKREGTMSFFSKSKTRQQFTPAAGENMTCPDFTSLIRNVLITKLVEHCQLTVETVFSQDGKYIYLLVAADEEDLKCQAEHTRFPVAIDLMIADAEAF